MEIKNYLSNAERSGSNESLTDLLTHLANNSATLVRDEIILARQELAERIKILGGRVVGVAVGAVLSFLGIIALLSAAAIGLGYYIGIGFSCLTIGIVLVAAGGIGMGVGIRSVKRTSLRPVQTMETIAEDKEWLKQLT